VHCEVHSLLGLCISCPMSQISVQMTDKFFTALVLSNEAPNVLRGNPFCSVNSTFEYDQEAKKDAPFQWLV
jgi:hypothetical protein